MIRKIIQIDEEKCNGCGACAEACHEGAIGMVNGKAKLLREDYCDGLGDCLPACPTDAITFIDKDTLPFAEKLPCGCPGTNSHAIQRTKNDIDLHFTGETNSALNQWPVQIKLVPVNAPYFNQANLLIAADCTAYAYGGFHSRFMRNHVTLIGCPKLDSIDYTDKLTDILYNNDIKSMTVVRMEVPCCGGLEHAAKAALQKSGKFIPWQVVTISTEGQIID